MSESDPLTGSKGKKGKGKGKGKQVSYAATTSDAPLVDIEQGINGGHSHLENGDPSYHTTDHGHSHASHSHSHSHAHGGGSASRPSAPPSASGTPRAQELSPRSAFLQGDVEASKRAHEAKKKKKQMENGELEGEKEGGHAGDAGEYIKSIVYGGLDGIITTFATVTSVAGAEFSAAVIVVLGISHLFADGLSMGMGDYMSSKAEEEFTASERAREKWEMDNAMQGEIEEMIELYIEKGISETDARVIINTLAKYPEAFLDHMMVVELGLLPPAADKGFSPRKAGLVTMCSFMGFGSIPLMPYLFALIPGVTMSVNLQLLIACVSTVITLFLLGAFKGRIAETGRSAWWKSGLLMAGNGSLAAGVGFVSGYLISNLMDLPAGAAG